MNAPLTPTAQADANTLGDAQDFADCCSYERWFVEIGIKPLQLAVDHLQTLACLWKLPAILGVDGVQAIMSSEFRRLQE